MNVHFSSKTDLWSTPDDFYKDLDQQFRFDLDVCATDENARCKKYLPNMMMGLNRIG